MANKKVNKDDLSFSSLDKENDIERRIEMMTNHLNEMNKKTSELNKIYDVLMNPTKSKVFSAILKHNDSMLKMTKESITSNSKKTSELIKELNNLKNEQRNSERITSKDTIVGRSRNYDSVDSLIKRAFRSKKSLKGQTLLDEIGNAVGGVATSEGEDLLITKGRKSYRLNNMLNANGALAQSVKDARDTFISSGLINPGEKVSTKSYKNELSKQIRAKQREIELSRKSGQILSSRFKSQSASIDMKSKAIGLIIDTTTKALVKSVKVATEAFNTIGFDFANITKNVANIVSQALSSNGIGSYSIGNSLFTNSSARSNQMKYGLSSSSNYAMMQTMGILGMSSDEDLMYMNSNQREMFTALTNYYKARYNQLSKSGALQSIQKAQIDFQIFKQELSYKFLNWFANNKDRIMKLITSVMNVMEAIMPLILKVMTTIASVVSRIGGIFGAKSSNYLEGVSGTNINLTYTQNNNVGTVGSSSQLNDLLNQNASVAAKTIAAELSGKY